MKKLTFWIALVLLLCGVVVLASCGSETDETEYAEQTEGTGMLVPPTVETVEGGTETEGEREDAVSPIGNITYIYSGYQQGLAFVEMNGNSKLMHCIDKTGKTVFTVAAHSLHAGFHNGLALLQTTDGTVLCDRTGKIIKAEDLGGTEIVVVDAWTENPRGVQMFADGYILVKKTTTTFSGSTNEMAVFNAKLEPIVDFSADFYDVYTESISGATYLSGYIFYNSIRKDSFYVDLRTGKKTVNSMSDLYSKITSTDKTEFWVYYNGDGGIIYDRREYLFKDKSHTPIIDLSQYPTISSVTLFQNGFAGVTFKVEESSLKTRYYFTILNDKGKFEFDPIETGEIYDIAYENGTFVLDVRVSSTLRRLEVYDSDGKRAEKEYKASTFDSTKFGISDGVVWNYVKIKDDVTVNIYTPDLEPLF